jgi:hypothetical protein
MNTNIILDGVSAILNQLIATAVAEAIKPLQDRIVALEINQSMGKAVFQMADIDFNEAVRNVLDGYNFVDKNDVVDLVESVVDKAVESAIDAYDFSDSFDLSGEIESAVESAIDAYDFSDIIAENMPDELDKDVVQQMIEETIDACTIRRG